MMIMKKHIIFIISFILSTIGCSSFSFVERIGPSDGKLANIYIKQGKAYEEKKDPSLALKSYQLALTIAPSNQEAIKGRKRMEKALNLLAEKHYHAGLKFYREGQYEQGHQQFLKVLRFQPNHLKTIKILTTRKRIQFKRYITHTIQAGESLAKIAKLYYGDQSKFPLIAQYNNLKDAKRLIVGKKIKIPEIEGVKFLVDKKPIQTENRNIAGHTFPDFDDQWQKYLNATEEEQKYRLGVHREQGIALFNQEKYQEAIDELNKGLSIASDDNDSIEYISKSHFQLALTLYNNKDYLSAKKHFERSLKYKKDCQDCKKNIQKSEEGYKEFHYKQGMQYYGEEKLAEAIKEWELVVVFDPNYKNVDYLINKAKTILTKVKEIKEDQKQNNK